MKRSLRTLALLTAATVPANAVLVSGTNLGALGIGDTANIVGDTATGANNADYYANIANPAYVWGNELVYEFSLTQTALVQATLNSASADPDTFLLSGLGTGFDGALNFASNGIAAAFLDGALGTTETYAIVAAGTYYLSIDAFGAGGTTTFDLDLSISAAPPAPAAVSLGILGPDLQAFTIDSFGSAFDTELGLFDGVGNLITNNDDAGGVFQSEMDLIAGLGAGEYFVALGGWDTAFGGGFNAAGGGDAGDFVLNHPNGMETGSTSPNGIAWFNFSITPEPGTISLLAFSGLAFLRRRRRD